jgi:hypothetical protein
MPANLARLVWWGRRHAPASVRAEMFDFSVARLGRLQLLEVLRPALVKRDRLGNAVTQVRWSTARRFRQTAKPDAT